MGTLAEDARALIAATADVAGEQVSEARQRLAAALESGQEMCEHVREQAVESVQAADGAVCQDPYPVIGTAVGAGAIIGFLAARREGSRLGRGSPHRRGPVYGLVCCLFAESKCARAKPA